MKNEVNKEYAQGLGWEAENNNPSLFDIWLHNDDFTPKELVVEMLEKLFYLCRRKATDIMMEARIQGKAICGTFSKDFAEAKVSQVEEYAKECEQPLLCSMEVAK